MVHIDIANDSVTAADYKPDEDPTKFKSEKTGRGPLRGQWMDKVQTIFINHLVVYFLTSATLIISFKRSSGVVYQQLNSLQLLACSLTT